VVLLEKARGAGNPVIYSLTSSVEVPDIREEVTPVSGEPIIKSGVDKVLRDRAGGEPRSKGVETVILMGKSAHGAVLNTTTGVAAREFNVVVSVD
jgi:nicotinamidase-related amidase